MQTRTPTQVASHAQKYFNRLSNKHKRKRNVLGNVLDRVHVATAAAQAAVAASTPSLRNSASEDAATAPPPPLPTITHHYHIISATSNGRTERKEGPWTEEEHRLFLLGLQKLRKGDWRGISRYYVQTRTHTQVRSHARNYFNRLSNVNKRMMPESNENHVATAAADRRRAEAFERLAKERARLLALDKS